MDTTFWTQLESYKQSNQIRNSEADSFVSDYKTISKLVRDKMYSREVGDMFCEIVGSDDGHDDLCDFIIWNGKPSTSNFLSDPKTAIPLAETMSQHPGFDGDINSLKRMIFY